MDVNSKSLGDEKEARLERIAQRGQKAPHSSIHVYSKFVHLMRLALPLCALAIVVVLYLRSGLEEQVIKPIEDVVKAPDLQMRSISRNELLRPKFESIITDGQPYEITAERAVQGEKNKDLIMLDQPTGKITMKDGMHMVLHSLFGAYRQDTGRFFLEGDVQFVHDGGYRLQTQEAHIDLKQGYAWSEKGVKGTGVDMSVSAAGVRADNNTGEVVFSGPATLVLEKGMKGL